MTPFASTPEPPYVAVIFTSVRTPGGDRGYTEMASRMSQLAARQPGFLGMESSRDDNTGLGITVSYWTDEWSAAAWKGVAEHLEAQRKGRDEWYIDYRVRIASVGREYSRGTTPRELTGARQPARG